MDRARNGLAPAPHGAAWLLKRIAMLGASLALSLVAAEFGLRAFLPTSYRQPAERVQHDWRELIHQPSPIDGLAYELAPNREGYAGGAWIRTNSLGMRDTEPVAPGTPRVRRLAVIGDSFTFGAGVANDETYPNVLETLLNTDSDYRYDVLNFGVSGYNARDAVLVLTHKALALEPDALIFGYVLNDPETDPIQPVDAYFASPKWWQHSHLLRRIAEAQHGRDVQRLGDGDYLQYLHAHPEKWGSVLEAFADIERISQREGLPVILLVFPMTPLTSPSWRKYPYRDLHRQVASAAREAGFMVIDLLDVWEKYYPLQLRVSAEDKHPNVPAHAMTAMRIHKLLMRNEAQFFGE